MAEKTVGTLIKEARTAAGLTQEQLARKIKGVSADDISLAERGKKDFTQAVLKEIAKATGVTQKSLLDAAKAGSSAKTGASSKTGSSAKTGASPKTGSSAKTSAVPHPRREAARRPVLHPRREAVRRPVPHPRREAARRPVPHPRQEAARRPVPRPRQETAQKLLLPLLPRLSFPLRKREC